MPTGCYVRSKETLKKMKRNLQKGRSKGARAKATITLRAIWKDPSRRNEVSERNQKLMRSPKIRAKHLRALKQSNAELKFKGGNGQDQTSVIKKWSLILSLAGFISECVVKTKNQETGLKCPPSYKIDFGRRKDKIAIELDGSSHKSFKQLKRDEKKNMILESLGWTVFRIKHK